MDERELEKEGTWDLSKAEKRPGIRKRTVVSVAFNSRDFERISERAEQLEMKVSQYVRNAALQGIERPAHIVSSVSSSLGGVLRTPEYDPATSAAPPLHVALEAPMRSVISS